MGSFRLGKFFRFNASRSGISFSGGIKGFRLSIGSKGIRSHITIPGTGYTKTNTLLSFKKLWKKKASKDSTEKAGKTSKKEQDILQDELILVIPKRRTIGRFTDKGKGDRLVNKAIEAYNKEDYSLAVTHFKAARALMPDDMEVILYLAVISYLYMEDYRSALTYFDLLEEDMYNEDMKLAIGDCFYELGDYDDATVVLESFAFSDNEDMERLTLLARCHMARDNNEAAEALLKKAIGRKRKMTPYLMEAKYWLGVLYQSAGDDEGAKKHLMAVYAQDSTYEDVAAKIALLTADSDILEKS